MSYLGHAISKDWVVTNPTNIKTIPDLAMDTTVTELGSLMRLCSYYQRFLKGHGDNKCTNWHRKIRHFRGLRNARSRLTTWRQPWSRHLFWHNRTSQNLLYLTRTHVTEGRRRSLPESRWSRAIYFLRKQNAVHVWKEVLNDTQRTPSGGVLHTDFQAIFIREGVCRRLGLEESIFVAGLCDFLKTCSCCCLYLI